MTTTTLDIAAPVGERERIGEVDILRGLALLGVLIMNFTAFAGSGVMATQAQLAALPSATVDWWAYEAVRVLVGDKANTVFATLFGLGFYIQLSRSEGKPGFERRYARRLFWLLLFGWANTLLLWMWDILNLYAVAGFGLLLMRKWSTRSLVIVGLAMSLYSDHLQAALVHALHLPVPQFPQLASDAAVLDRQSVAAAGHYPALVALFGDWTLKEWVLGGVLVAWIVYALGRFALGAAIGRSGLFEHVGRHLPMLRMIARWCIPLGIAFGVAIRIALVRIDDGSETLVEAIKALRSPVALILAAGYCAGVLVALQSSWGRTVFRPFGAVGRMALTNYLLQGFIYGFVLFGVGPGLALAGKIGTVGVLAICFTFFAAQIAFSHWWLARYRFGPMEWLWRTLTYGERPTFRRARAAPHASAAIHSSERPIR
jgi:uncharacterized protein